MRVRRLQVHLPEGNFHIATYCSIYVAVQTEAGYAVIVMFNGCPGFSPSTRADGVDEWRIESIKTRGVARPGQTRSIIVHLH
jgi:hypothetical protein